MLIILPAAASADFELGRQLFTEYAAGLDFSLCFQYFEQELAELASQYGSPQGRLLIARDELVPIGCVGVRRFSDKVCEMKRLYVRPEFRRHGIGRRLAVASMQAARELGYERMRLDTVASMTEAIALYRSLGFTDTERYRPNPHARAVYLEVLL